MKPAHSVSTKLRNYLAGAGLVAACAFSGSAQAGNIEPIPVEPEVIAPVAAEMPSWAGVYVGGKIGYAFNGDERVGHRNAAGVLVTPVTGKLDYEGFNYGLRLGWRGERPVSDRLFVYGLELGYDAGDPDDSFNNGGYSAAVDMNHVLGLRLKSGLTSKSGETLLYGILGYVRGDFDYAVSGTAGSGDVIALDTSFDTDGYSIGLGVEHMLNERWSVNAEWEYMEFGSKHLYDSTGQSTKATPKYNNIQLGVNFRF